MSSVSGPSPPAVEEPPKVRLAQGQEVSLGCGTLILIAVIVLIFSRGGTGDLDREIQSLRTEVGELKQAVEVQTGLIKALRDRLDQAEGQE